MYLNSPKSSVVFSSIFSGLGYVALSIYTPALQVVNLTLNALLTSIVGASLGFYLSFLLPALLVALTIGFLAHYLSNNELLNNLTIERTCSNDSISTNAYVEKIDAQFFDSDADENISISSVQSNQSLESLGLGCY